MCGIVGITGQNDVTARLLDGLQRLEYRGYDSAGIAIAHNGMLERRRAAGRLQALRDVLSDTPLMGTTGIAHTRWATHGKPNVPNAHPHMSGPVAIVHNGIIENFQELREELQSAGRLFESDTDSEVIAQMLAQYMDTGSKPREAFGKMLDRLSGAFAIAAIFAGEDGLMMGARKGSPLVLGFGDGEMYLGSDAIALASLTRDIIYLAEGDWVEVYPDAVTVFDEAGHEVERPRVISQVNAAMVELGEYSHFMLKEIHEQPEAIARTVAPYIDQSRLSVISNASLDHIWIKADRVVGVSCGTSNYAAQTAKYWFEAIAGLAVETDIASEFRYRHPVLPQSGAAIFISQSGETADTLAALKYCKERDIPTIALVNVPESSIARNASEVLQTYAGPEIGVASTKAFTAQLAVLASMTVAAGRARGKIDAAREAELLESLLGLPRLINETFQLEAEIKDAAKSLSGASSALYLGRGVYMPLAMEGALKLKEVSYIHAEGYAAGELKHGPIALIEDGLPVVVVAPYDDLFEKTLSNISEIEARGASVILLSDARGVKAAASLSATTILLPETKDFAGPIVCAVVLQLLAYHVALIRGTDVDKPRNLAKSVTVE